ncbi:MAG: hypothetical protein GXO75_15195 [Calditrichaeota bacterium]|nr:hypothetical protein [Calditrichota bacterium]
MKEVALCPPAGQNYIGQALRSTVVVIGKVLDATFDDRPHRNIRASYRIDVKEYLYGEKYFVNPIQACDFSDKR